MTYLEMKHRLLDLGMPMSDVVRELGTRYHEKISTPELNCIMTGKQSGAKAERVKKEVAELLGAE